MEKDYNLQCIDYAIAKTIERANENPELKDLATEKHLTNAIIEYMFKGNAKGFSSKDNGRRYILQLSKDDFEEQLLKHVVKSENAKTRLGLKQRLGTNKSFEDDLTIDDVQAVIYKAYGEMNMEAIKYILNKYPALYQALATNFVKDRYFNLKLGAEVLDKYFVNYTENYMENYQNNYYYKKIDEFYSSLRKENSMQK